MSEMLMVKLPDGIVVRRYRSPKGWHYDAWKLVTRYGSHSTVIDSADGRLGRIGSEQLPSELDAAPFSPDVYSEARIAKVNAFRESFYAAAYAAIEAAFPEAAESKQRTTGTIIA